MRKEAILKIYGDVQGVFYRGFSEDRAHELGLTGWVKNMSDGSVEMCLHGDEDTIKEMISKCYDGPPASQVEEIQTDWKSLDSEKEFESFEICY